MYEKYSLLILHLLKVTFDLFETMHVDCKILNDIIQHAS